MKSPIALLPHYTRFVHLSKRALWVLAILLTIILLVVAGMGGGQDGSRFTLGANSKQGKEHESVMVHPQYHSVDSKDRPYTVIANRAIQRSKELVTLESIQADMLLEDRTWLALTSGLGDYNQAKDHLFLSEVVNMFYEDGYAFHSSEAHVDVSAGTAYGDKPVEGQGPTGTLIADSFRVTDNGKILYFQGNVKVTLYPE